MDQTLKSVIEEIGKKSLRSSIITTAAIIDVMLEKLLKKYFVDSSDFKDLFSGQGPLSTFSAKIKISYALGLISKELRDDLNLYRKIRNKCAHDIVINTDTKECIANLSNNFQLWKKVFRVGANEDLQIYTSLEFMVIFICLIKRINNVERLSAFPMEVHDNYLGLDKSDNDFLSNFGSAIK